MRVAIVHDWLYTIGGAERVLQAMLRCYPGATLFSLIDRLDPESRRRIGYSESQTSFLQKMPFIGRRHRLFLPLMPLAIEQFDLRGFDLVISSSYAVAKGVLTGPDQLHISYVHSPMRYAWDLQGQYLEESRLQHGLRSWLVRYLLHRLRIWDVRTAASVDRYVTNSEFVGRRIRKLYGRTATVIHPPVRVPPRLPRVAKESFFLTASRLVQYKNVRVLVEAFRDLPAERLLVVGDGPEFKRLNALAPPNVRLLGFLDDAALRSLMQRAAAFVFAGTEDFGITLVEAQAAGTPVIALGRGGARETIVTDGPEPTGLFFPEATPAAAAAAVRDFLARREAFSPQACHANARQFSEARFERAFKDFVAAALTAFELKKAGTDLRPAGADRALRIDHPVPSMFG